ncbi:MAG: discoidin domain-containing protein [Acidobacteriota bacterium]|nr:discoidin domain-containing protein [Acidobacteriota bacterium]MDY0231890.1 discoidin domain-containing protein [Candidatus Saccharicenans sp.]
MGKLNHIKIVGIVLSCGLLLSVGAPEVSQKSQGQEKVELKIELPKPMFIGTPRNIKSPNLEIITGKPRGPFFAPKGTELVSLKKPVTSSDSLPVIGELSYVTDGEKSGEDGYFVELGPGPQWVQIDLEAPYLIQAIVVWHYHSQARVYRDVIIQVSEDKDFQEGIVTLFNNDHDNSSGLGAGGDKEYIETYEGKLIDGRSTRARYVRLWSNGNTSNDMNHYVEVEVYGLPVR